MLSLRKLPIVFFVGLLFFANATLFAQKNPFSRFTSYRQIEANPEKDYKLAESNGPWMILAASFAGDGAFEEARQLTLELRKRFKWPAYVHSHHFDFTKPVEGRGLDEYGNPLKMRYRQSGSFDEIAVLIGDFPGVTDSTLQKTLKAVKYCRPSCLTLTKEKPSTLRFAGLRHWHKKLTRNEEKMRKGPMGQAFITRNPLLPQEYFTPTGFDSFVAKMNRGVEYSLLKCPAKYTVRVATFRGQVIIDPKKVAEIERTGRGMKSKLTQAAEKANRLARLLRDRNVEAYEFHDRTESIVTVGSFQAVGTPRQDGKIEIDPRILKVMENYGARRTRETIGGSQGMKPRSLGGIPFDIQPTPVEVPQRSIAADYARRGIIR